MDYKGINKNAWDIKTPLHVESAFYNNDGFKHSQNSLNQIELDILGDVSGLRILHLQCHFGQDTLSLTKKGAHAVGVDLSSESISVARSLSAELNIPCMFIESDVYDLVHVEQEPFDIVFTSYGTIGWLPDLDKWAGVVKSKLKNGGRFILVEFHPFIWTMDYKMDKIGFDYFNTGPIVETEKTTYTGDETNASYETVSWNHPLSEVIRSLIKAGGSIVDFNEYDYSPYPCFENMTEFDKGKWRFKHIDFKIPMVYSLEVTF